MNIWLLHVGEELPVDERPRLFRYGHLAEALAERGHQVLRWAPTFQHALKRYRFERDTLVDVRPGYQIQFVHSGGYHRNVSWARFRAYRQLAQRFTQLCQEHSPPDLILSGIPSPAWCEAALNYAHPRNIPLVLDVRDLWPDVFMTVVPSFARPVARQLLAPQFRQAQRICSGATAITAVSRSYLDWGLRNAGRRAEWQDQVFPLGYRTHAITEEEFAAKRQWLAAQGVDEQKTIACYFGLFETSGDLRTVVEAARRLHAAGQTDLQIVLCGRGGQQAELEQAAAELPNLVLLGWVDTATIAAVMRLSSIGLATYTAQALQSLPNKPFEYMAGRLAVVSSLEGELEQLLQTAQCGVNYRAGDGRSLAEVLQRLVANPGELHRLGENAYRVYDTQFRSEVIAHQMVDHLETMTGSSAQKQAIAA